MCITRDSAISIQEGDGEVKESLSYQNPQKQIVQQQKVGLSNCLSERGLSLSSGIMELSVYSVWTPGLKGYILVISLQKGKTVSRETSLCGCPQELWNYVTRKAVLSSKMGLLELSHHQKAFPRTKTSPPPLTCSKPSLSRDMGVHTLLSTDSESSRRYYSQPL